MQNPLLKFRQSSIISEKPGYLSEKLNPLTSSIEFNIFCWSFAHVSYLPVSTKWSSEFFILFRSWVTDKPSFYEYVETMSFLILANTSRSKQNEKSPEHRFVDIGK